MREEFLNFIESPDRSSYLAVREALIRSDRYDPYSDELETVEAYLEDGNLADAYNTISESMHNLLLSPCAHLAWATIMEKRGENERASMERFFASACVKGILSTGDGSKDNPYTVVRASDEYDALEYLGKRMQEQTLLRVGNRHFDVLRCADGSEVWFDITDAYRHLQREMSGNG